MRHTRYGHETIPLSDTRFMLFGGWGVSDNEAKETYCALYNPDGSCNWTRHYERTREVEVFDLNTGCSTLVGHTLTGRYDFSAIPLPDNTIFIHGGASSSVLGYFPSELYSCTTGKIIYIGEEWNPTVKKTMPKEWKQYPCRMVGEGIDYRAILVGDVILLAGEDFAAIYNWRVLSKLNKLKQPYIADKLLVSRTDHHLLKTPGGRVFVIGGRCFNYVPMSDALKNMPDFTARRAGPAETPIEEFVFPQR